MRRVTTVTNGPWNVGATITGGEYRISLFRKTPSGKFYHHPEYDGMLMEESAAKTWLLEHGFLQRWYRGVWCPTHRRLHRWCHSRTGPCATASGHPYDGCEEAQARWDAENWSYMQTDCERCKKRFWGPRWLRELWEGLPVDGRAEYWLCPECSWVQRKSERP